MKIDEAANLVLFDVKLNKEIDPITISIIVSIIIFFLQSCVLNKKRLNNLGWADKLRLRWKVWRECPKNCHKEVYQSFLDRCARVTQEDIDGLYKDLPNVTRPIKTL